MSVFMYECANDIHVYMKGGRIGRILSPVMSVFLQLHIHCESYHSGDYDAERLVHSIILLFFMLFKYILM
jgi:hypothetical protein